MTAPIVFHSTRWPRPAGTPLAYDSAFHAWIAGTSGQLWSRVAEGRKQVWS
jgi:hypothetical protein